MLKKDNGAICRACFYIKRGSLNNMKLSELVTHLETNDDFADKRLIGTVIVCLQMSDK